VAADRSDDAPEPPVERPDHPADRPNAPADHTKQSRRDQIEPRSIEEYNNELRATTESPEPTEPATPSEPSARSEPTENGHQSQSGASWDEKAEESRWMWGEYKRRFPPEERPPVDRSTDPPGSWRGDSSRYLDPSKNERTEAECDRIVEREEKIISPRLREVESCDLDRHLVGFEERRKGRDGIKEKVAKGMAEKGLSLEEAIALVPDSIRFTFQYKEARYTEGVWSDIARLQEQGFKLEKRKNSWSDEQYKGINSQWIEPVSGQRFEVQFHTRISFEAKQITHPAYERLRTYQADKFEEMVLEAFQRKVTAEVPIPLGAAEIPDYPERGQDAR